MRAFAYVLAMVVATSACTDEGLGLGPGSQPDAGVPVVDGGLVLRDAGPGDAGVEVAPGRSLATGNNHSCARTPQGTVECWGLNENGLLGDGTTEPRSTPVAVVGLADVVELESGIAHTCARLRDGPVRCWGRNDRGALGDGTTEYRATPVEVGDLRGVRKLSAGAWHTCALMLDGSIRCWGGNEHAQLGDGTMTERTTPVVVANLPKAIDVAAGDDFTCALGEDGTVRCWGFIVPGGLVGTFPSNGTTTGTTAFVPIPDLGDEVVAISAGRSHACALMADGTARCWGANTNGELGDTTRTHRVTPVEVYQADGVVELDLAGFSCGRWRDGSVRCWGAYRSDGVETYPRAVEGIRDAVEISVGTAHGCARLSDGTVRCWGYNGDGQSTAGGCCHGGLCGIPEGTACGADGVCTDGWCSDCGGPEQRCCDPLQPDGPCRPDTPLCTADRVCSACGALGQPCCSGAEACAAPGPTCFEDRCVMPGDPGTPCLEGNACNSGCCVLTNHSQHVCIAVDAVCPGPEGAEPGACDSDGSCGACGGLSQACCPSESSRVPYYCSAPATHCAEAQCVAD
ncbi:MAG: hypothetical protein H6730_32260 [Deltaproteobacteria bacterium]|nr:hypothetical protein [Deltaproteobacteria bacterium]